MLTVYSGWHISPILVFGFLEQGPFGTSTPNLELDLNLKIEALLLSSILTPDFAWKIRRKRLQIQFTAKSFFQGNKSLLLPLNSILINNIIILILIKKNCGQRIDSEAYISNKEECSQFKSVFLFYQNMRSKWNNTM